MKWMVEVVRAGVVLALLGMAWSAFDPVGWGSTGHRLFGWIGIGAIATAVGAYLWARFKDRQA